MTQQLEAVAAVAAVGVPEWDTPDRLRKALRTADVGVQEMAVYLGVSRSTISNYLNDRIEPSKRTLRLWAFRCGVSFNWLCHGDTVPCGPGGNRDVSAGQRGVMIPCSFPPPGREIYAFRPRTGHRGPIYTATVDQPVAA